MPDVRADLWELAQGRKQRISDLEQAVQDLTERVKQLESSEWAKQQLYEIRLQLEQKE